MPSRTNWVHFQEVKLQTKRSGKCSGCQKRTSRTLKVWQTINPFNKNGKGSPKTREEILVELRAQLAEKRTTPLLCTNCE